MSLYRASTLGRCLNESLAELLQENTITSNISERILKQFDESFVRQHNNLVDDDSRFNGRIQTYRYVDGVWTFVLENATFNVGSESFHADYVKIVALDDEKLEKLTSTK